ncbi:MAG: Uma2 family endonuclease [Rudaea sp.]|uniref:Uma2 family endonuclease n=1 Tax=Rudaea sp. TaxID=2136325 RepID=UPI0039E65233
MSVPASKTATYEDLLALPMDRVGEIVHGALYSHPRPASKHAISSSVLGSELLPPFQRGRGGPGGWWIIDEPELHLDGNVLVPDLAGWRRERMPEFPDVAWFELAPDWICEILSPSTARLDRVQKMPIYAETGVEFLWFVDPDLRTLEAYRREGATWLLLGGFADQEAVRVAPFDAIALELGSLWA